MGFEVCKHSCPECDDDVSYPALLKLRDVAARLVEQHDREELDYIANSGDAYMGADAPDANIEALREALRPLQRQRQGSSE